MNCSFPYEGATSSGRIRRDLVNFPALTNFPALNRVGAAWITVSGTHLNDSDLRSNGTF